MKTILVALTAAVISAASVGTVGVFSGVSSEKELAVTLPLDADGAAALVPFIERAARERGLTGIRAYQRDVFVPLEQASLSFVRNGDSFSMHVEVETQYRFAKGNRAAALENVKKVGDAIFTRALQLQGQANG
jgi:hypothetical protein